MFSRIPITKNYHSTGQTITSNCFFLRVATLFIILQYLIFVSIFRMCYVLKCITIIMSLAHLCFFAYCSIDITLGIIDIPILSKTSQLYNRMKRTLKSVSHGMHIYYIINRHRTKIQYSFLMQ